MRLEDWRQSGKSAWAYASANGLSPQTFVKWTKTGTEAKSCFVEVPVPAIPSAQREPEILIEKGEVKMYPSKEPLLPPGNKMK